MLCGLYAGHARDITIYVYRSIYQVYRISRTKEVLFQAGGFGCGGISCFLATSVCVALIFERAGGASKPDPPFAARNSSSVYGTTADEGSLL